MAGNAKAWKLMKEYQIQDVNLLLDLYDILKPWIRNHPNMGLKNGDPLVCRNCSSDNIIKYGTRYANNAKYQRYRCQDCGTSLRGELQMTGKRT
jgi:DNA-directed RNA polymerase subunit RPC12/RpoP